MELSTSQPAKWMRAALLNFAVVALAGMTLRYKVSYSLPAIEFKNLLHAHSHFAFAGWVTTALFAVIIHVFLDPAQQQKKVYRNLFLAGQVTSYGMFFSFLFQEYGPISITFSTLYIFVTYCYAWMLWKDTKHKAGTLPVTALRFSLICLVLSSFGPFGLAAIIAAHLNSGALYHNAIYWYLHFQYNGWFSFGIFATGLTALGAKYGTEIMNRLKTPFRIMIIACIPSYLLSVLWVAPPLWVYIVAGTGAVMQIVALVFFIGFLLREKAIVREDRKLPGGTLLLLALISMVIKLILQVGLVFPYLNQFVFGHRPVIIGFLHLVLLGFVSFFLIGMALRNTIFTVRNRIAPVALTVFVCGVILNEVCLLLQGIANMTYTPMHALPFWLFVAAVSMFTGIAAFAVSQQISSRAGIPLSEQSGMSFGVAKK